MSVTAAMDAEKHPRAADLSPFVRYASRPRLFEGENAARCLTFGPNGEVEVTALCEHELEHQRITVPAERVHDLLVPTMYGLLDDLAPGSPLMEQFLPEWERVQELLVAPQSNEDRSYGTWVLYPRTGDLVRFAPKYWHKIALLVRNATLLSASHASHDWLAARQLLGSAVLGVAGCSVGSNIMHAAVGLARPAHVKLADLKDYQLNNANRIRVTYADYGRNKAVVCAEQVHAVDPFVPISVFDTGIDQETVDLFVLGSPEHSEPRTTLVVEETDDPEAKLLVRERARAAKVPVVMVTDAGPAAIVDVRRFDRAPDLPLTFDTTDAELYELKRAWDQDAGDRNRLLDFAFAISGRNEVLATPEIREILLQEVPLLFAGLPQLGSTAAIAGGIAATAIARVLLGFPMWERLYFDPVEGRAHAMGEMI